MKSRQILRLRRLRSGLPAIALECTAAPRLLWLCIAPTSLVICALVFASAPQLYWRVLLAGVVAFAAVPAVRLGAGLPAPNRVRALGWDAEGHWWLTDDEGVCVQARLTRAHILGPFIFLNWKDFEMRRRRAAIDASAGQAAQSRALIGRLRHQAC